VEIFPHSSVAVHILETLYVPAHDPSVTTSSDVSENADPQISSANAWAKPGAFGQLIVVGSGSGANTGPEISCT